MTVHIPDNELDHFGNWFTDYMLKVVGLEPGQRLVLVNGTEVVGTKSRPVLGNDTTHMLPPTMCRHMQFKSSCDMCLQLGADGSYICEHDRVRTHCKACK